MAAARSAVVRRRGRPTRLCQGRTGAGGGQVTCGSAVNEAYTLRNRKQKTPRRGEASVCCASGNRENGGHVVASVESSSGKRLEDEDLFGDVPAFMWVGLGVILCAGTQRAMGAMRDAAMKAAMQQMMKQAGSGIGANPMAAAMRPPPQQPPFSSPFGAGLGAQQMQQPFAGFGAQQATQQAPQQTVSQPQTTQRSTTVTENFAMSSSSSAAAAAAAAAAQSAVTETTATPTMSTVGAMGATQETEKEQEQVPTSTSSSSSVFQDVVVESMNASAAADGGAVPPPPPPPPPPFPGMDAGPIDDAEMASKEEMMKVVEKWMQDPAMREQIYQHLPEGMRNQEALDMLMKNPLYRAQLVKMLPSMPSVSPEFATEMKDYMDPEKMNAQLAAMGTTPEEFIGTLQSNPDLMAKMGSPKFQNALVDISRDPANAIKYQGDPEIMNTILELQKCFPNAPGGMNAGGMPPGM